MSKVYLTKEGLKQTLQNIKSVTDDLSKVSTQSTNGLMSATDKVKLDNLAPIQNGTGTSSIKFVDGIASGDYSIAGGTASKDIVNNMFGSLASALITLKGPEANGNLSLALGTNIKAISPGTMVSGFGSSAGIKGYYWWSFNTSTKVIELSTNRPGILTSRSKPTSLDWAVGDLVVINNGTRYSNIRITAVDTTNMTITVDNIPFTTDEYKGTLGYSHDTPNDRFIYAFKENSQENLTDRVKPRWESRNGEIEFGFASTSIGVHNVSAGMLSVTENYNNLAVSDYAHVEGRKNIGGYGAHVEGANNEGWGIASHTEGNGNVNTGKYAHAGGMQNTVSGGAAYVEGRENTVSGSYAHGEGYKNTVTADYAHGEGQNNTVSGESAHAEGRENTVTGANSHAGGYKNIVNSGYSFSTGRENTIESSASQSFVSGKDNLIKGTDSIAVGRQNFIYSSKSSGFGGRNKLSLNGSTGEGYQFAAGAYNIVNNQYSSTLGYYNKTSTQYQTVIGTLNKTDSSALFIVGNGTITDTATTGYTAETNSLGNTVYTNRKNIFTVKSSGKVIGGSNTTDSDTDLTLTTKKYVDNKVNSKTDTKNTAGANDTSNKIYLVGATEQTANPVTYTHDTAYVGTNGQLYSGGKLVAITENEDFTGDFTVNGSLGSESYNSVAIGENSYADGAHSIAIGQLARASTSASIAIGFDTTSRGGEGCVAIGAGVTADGTQIVLGTYNTVDTNKLLIIGNGGGYHDGLDDNSNAHTLDWEGNAWYAGRITAGADPVDDMDVTTKKYLEEFVCDSILQGTW